MEYENGRVFTSTFLVLCSGNVQLPNRLLEDTLRKDFEGEIHHSCTLKSFVPEHKGKRVMLIGGEKQPVMLWRNGVTTLSALYGAFHAPPPPPPTGLSYPLLHIVIIQFYFLQPQGCWQNEVVNLGHELGHPKYKSNAQTARHAASALDNTIDTYHHSKHQS